MNLGDLLVFFTGADHEPPLGFYPKPQLQFHHQPRDILATSSTCSNVLYIPTCHKIYSDFRSRMIQSLLENDGFGRI